MSADIKISASHRARRLAGIVVGASFLAWPAIANAGHSPEFSVTPPQCEAPCTVALSDATTYPPGETPSQRYWNVRSVQNDGSASKSYWGASASHSFDRPGEYTIYMWSETNTDARNISESFTVAAPVGKRCNWTSETCLVGDKPLIAPGRVEFELPRGATSPTGTWQQPPEAGHLGDWRSFAGEPTSDRVKWAAVLPPGATDGVITLSIRAKRDGGHTDAWAEFRDVPVLAAVTDAQADVIRKRRAYRAVLSYDARRDVQARMISILFGTKPNGKWVNLVERDLERRATGRAKHVHGFQRRLLRRKCRQHGPCRIASVALIFAEDYVIEDFVTVRRVAGRMFRPAR